MFSPFVMPPWMPPEKLVLVVSRGRGKRPVRAAPVVDISDANSACDNYDIATTLKDTRLIYQNPQHWTLHHLKAVNLQHETDVALDRIVDANYIPSDSDPGE